jgi:FMN phosphatase YigB (HAD superfamily)
MSAKPLYIFDLDGTLADCQHRTPILSETDDPNRWRRFLGWLLYGQRGRPAGREWY